MCKKVLIYVENFVDIFICIVGGFLFYEGRVEVYWNGYWGIFCSDLWNLNEVLVVCRFLGYVWYEL